MSRTRRLARSPALHFLLLGTLLLAADAAWSRLAASGGGRTIVIGPGDVAQLRRGFRQQYGRLPSPEEERGLVEHAIDEEVLYRRAIEIGLDHGNRVVRQRLAATMRLLAEDPGKDDETLVRDALALGLDKRDIVVRRHLVQLMSLILKRAAATTAVTDTDLERMLERDDDRYRLPAQLTLTHVYFDPARRGEHLESDVERALGDLRAGRVAANDAPALGDPFLLGSRFVKRSDAEMKRLLGNGFAEAAMRAAPDRWSDPVRSPYGVHLVFVEERVPGRLPALEAVKNQLAGRLLEERGEQALRSKLAEMRARYAIHVERGDGAAVATAETVSGTVLPVPRPARELGD